MIRGKDFESEGWTLNVSRGGARLVVEEPVEPGVHYELSVGQPGGPTAPREVRIIWVQDEQDGQIVGVQFMDVEGSVPPPPSSVGQDKPVPSKG